MLENRIPGEAADIELLLVGAAERVNEAHLDLAELYMSGRDHVKWMEAAGRVQTAYEVALGEDDNAQAQRCLAAAPPIIAKLEGAHPTMPDGLAQDFVVTRFMFDEKGRPDPSRAVRTRHMVDLVRELARVRGTGASQEQRLLRDFGSNMGGAKAPQPALRRPSAVLPITELTPLRYRSWLFSPKDHRDGVTESAHGGHFALSHSFVHEPALAAQP